MTDTPSPSEWSERFDGGDSLATALEDAFPERSVDEVRPTGPSWNDTNETIRVAFTDGGTVFLKIARDGDGSRIARECTVIDYVRTNCDVAVPTVFASDSDASVPYLATEPMAGRSLLDDWSEGDDEERAAIARQVGNALAEIHSRRFPDHGQIVGGDADKLALETGTWTDVLVDRIRYTRTLATTDRFDHHYDEVIAAVEENRALLDDAPATLVHGDPAKPNCFRDERGVGFVDWEIAHVGDPARELHRARSQQFGSEDDAEMDRLIGALHEGYRERAGALPDGFTDRVPVYDAVRYLGRSGFFDKWIDYASEPEDELAKEIEDEMARRLNEIR